MKVRKYQTNSTYIYFKTKLNKKSKRIFVLKQSLSAKTYSSVVRNVLKTLLEWKRWSLSAVNTDRSIRFGVCTRATPMEFLCIIWSLCVSD